MALFNGSQQEYYETNNKGSYQYIALADIINNFIVSYVGDDKIITTAKKNEVAFHAQRAIQELNYDTLRSIKSYEMEVPPSLSLPLPHDYVNYVKITWTDENGVERVIYIIDKIREQEKKSGEIEIETKIDSHVKPPEKPKDLK